jgi:histidinol-phosphate phosphatase family protein
VFLDRDGTINVEVEHLKRAEELELFGGAAEAVGRLNRAGYLAVVVTNQSVVARGEVTREGLERIHAHLDHLLGLHHAYLDRIYACPHYPDPGLPGGIAELLVDCTCRKPAIGSIDAACRDLGINLAESWLVGDTTSDIETGRRARLTTILVQTGHAGHDGRFPLDPDYVMADLAAAVDWILEGHPALRRRMAPVVAAAAGARLVVIGGLARSGKSSAARVLQEAASATGRAAHVIPLDLWLCPGPEDEANSATARYDIEGMLVTVRRLVGHRDRIAVELPADNGAVRSGRGHSRHFSIDADDLLIVEGAPALLVDRLVRLADVRVHMARPASEQATERRAGPRQRQMSEETGDVRSASPPTDEATKVEAAKARADFIVAAWIAA